MLTKFQEVQSIMAGKKWQQKAGWSKTVGAPRPRQRFTPWPCQPAKPRFQCFQSLTNGTSGWEANNTWACGRHFTLNSQCPYVLCVYIAAHVCTVVPWCLWMNEWCWNLPCITESVFAYIPCLYQYGFVYNLHTSSSIPQMTYNTWLGKHQVNGW